MQAKTVAEQLAAKLNTKLNYQPKEDEDKGDEDQSETFRKYEEELEINDFPQQARWRVTSKVNTVPVTLAGSPNFNMRKCPAQKWKYTLVRVSWRQELVPAEWSLEGI